MFITATAPFDFTADTFDSRDVIARIEYLAYLDDDPETPLDADDRAELADLRAFAEEAAACIEDWHHGATFISADYFEDYARDFADSIGAIDVNHGWPLHHIDWSAAADALAQDYSEVELRGRTYYAR